MRVQKTSRARVETVFTEVFGGRLPFRLRAGARRSRVLDFAEARGVHHCARSEFGVRFDGADADGHDEASPTVVERIAERLA